MSDSEISDAVASTKEALLVFMKALDRLQEALIGQQTTSGTTKKKAEHEILVQPNEHEHEKQKQPNDELVSVDQTKEHPLAAIRRMRENGELWLPKQMDCEITDEFMSRFKPVTKNSKVSVKAVKPVEVDKLGAVVHFDEFLSVPRRARRSLQGKWLSTKRKLEFSPQRPAATVVPPSTTPPGFWSVGWHSPQK